ncbi:hypothetical protein VTO42DRAFT_6570 [Malbranchea cinnamomea]
MTLCFFINFGLRLHSSSIYYNTFTPQHLQHEDRSHRYTMPTLKQLTCHVEHGYSTVPLKEYGTAYSDGCVETYIAIPSNPANIPTPFSIHLTSDGYIAPGLAMFVFIDGVYQCNRHRDDLVWDVKKEKEFKEKEKEIIVRGKGKKVKEKDKERERERRKQKRARDIDFVVRQKEERSKDGTWVGRPWRFEEFRVVNSMPDIRGVDVDPKTHFAELGDIMVVVLRCFSKGNTQNSQSDDDSDTPESAMAPGFNLNASDEEFSEDEGKSDTGNTVAQTPKGEQDSVEDDGGLFGGLAGFFDGDNGGYYAPPHQPPQYYYVHPNGPPPWHQQQPPPQQWNGYHAQWSNNHTAPPPPPPATTAAVPPPPPPPPQPRTYYPWYVPYQQYVTQAAPMQPHHSVPAPTSARQNHPCTHTGDTNPHLHTHMAPPPPPQKHVHWADRLNQGPAAAVTHPQPQHGHTAGSQSVVYVTPQPFYAPQQYQEPHIYTYIPPHQHHNDHGGYVIENGQRIYRNCEICRQASTQNKRGRVKNKNKGKNNKGDTKSGGKGKDGKKEKKGKDNEDKEKKDDQEHQSYWGAGWGGGENNDRSNDQNENNTNEENNEESARWDNSDAWPNNFDDHNNHNNQHTWNAFDNGQQSRQRALSPPRNSSDHFQSNQAGHDAGGGDPLAQTSNRRNSSPARNPTQNQTPAEEVEQFVTPKYQDPVPDEPPLYTVPEPIARERSLTHQVQVGSPLPYVHRVRTPQYLDTIEDPYAKFVFKYRRKDVIEKMFKVTVERDLEAERKVLESLPREQIVEQLFRMRGLMGNSPRAQKQQGKRMVSWNHKNNNSFDSRRYNWWNNQSHNSDNFASDLHAKLDQVQRDRDPGANLHNGISSADPTKQSRGDNGGGGSSWKWDPGDPMNCTSGQGNDNPTTGGRPSSPSWNQFNEDGW